MMTPYQYFQENGYFLDLEDLGGDEFSNCFFKVFYHNLVLKDNKVYMQFDNFNSHDIPFVLKLSENPFYPTQKPIRVNYVGIGANLKHLICYLHDDWEGKAEYERKLLLKTTKEQADIKPTTNKRKL